MFVRTRGEERGRYVSILHASSTGDEKRGITYVMAIEAKPKEMGYPQLWTELVNPRVVRNLRDHLLDKTT